MVEIMHDSGEPDTAGGEMLMTSAVAILFSLSSEDTHPLRSVLIIES
jgi:hypothetical protein